jgi:hypothetical protein
MATNEIPLSIDYTSRDYYAIRQELIDRVKLRIPEWTGTDSADFGVALVEAFAYMGDIANYYIDRIANESFIATATQRESLLAIAETYGFVPSGYANSLLTVRFFNNTTNAVTIPAGTRVIGDITLEDTVQQVTFTTSEQAIVPIFSGGVRGTVDVLCFEGEKNTVEANNVYGVLLGSSTGEPTQQFAIDDFPVVEASVEVYVKSGNTFKKWTRVTHLLDYGPNDTVYSTRLDKDNNLFIDFGDGVSGLIPTLHSEIRSVYVVGGGIIGNVPAATVTGISYIPGLTETQTASINGVIDVDNLDVGVGGREPDSNEIIRFVAPTYLRAQNRAVTLEDISTLALNVTEYVGKANAIGTSWTSVTLYLAPKRDNDDSDPHPGVDDAGDVTAEWTQMKEAVETYLADKLLVNTTVTYVKPTYVPVTMSIQWSLDPLYTQADAENNLKKAITYNFSYNFTPFNLTFSAQDIEYVLRQVAGVKKASVQFLYKTGGSPSLTDVQALQNEIITVAEADILLELV